MDYLKAGLLIGGIGMALTAVGIVTHDLAREIRYRSAFAVSVGPAAAFAMLGWAPLIIAIGFTAIVAK